MFSHSILYSNLNPFLLLLLSLINVISTLKQFMTIQFMTIILKKLDSFYLVIIIIKICGMI